MILHIFNINKFPNILFALNFQKNHRIKVIALQHGKKVKMHFLVNFLCICVANAFKDNTREHFTVKSFKFIGTKFCESDTYSWTFNFRKKLPF